MTRQRTRALVTGASSGIGAEYARQLAAQGVHLILTARNDAKLSAVAREVEEAHGVEVETLLADLATRSGIDKVAARIKQATDLDVLVNCAGFGAPVALAEADTEVQLAMMTLHMTAPMLLTKVALPAMIERQRGEIINVASTAAFIPVPKGANYAATKAYLVGFSESLQNEVAEHGIRVQAPCMGLTRTDFYNTETWTDDMSWTEERYWMDAADVVRESLAQLDRDGVVYIPGRPSRELVAQRMAYPYYLDPRPGWFARLKRWWSR